VGGKGEEEMMMIHRIIMMMTTTTTRDGKDADERRNNNKKEIPDSLCGRMTNLLMTRSEDKGGGARGRVPNIIWGVMVKSLLQKTLKTPPWMRAVENKNNDEENHKTPNEQALTKEKEAATINPRHPNNSKKGGKEKKKIHVPIAFGASKRK
jgi:hypothetical protein